jgi:AcrR family transcriptional regulator
MALITEAELSLRERKKRQTRRALQRAAVALVAERGLDQVTVEDIAGAAEVSRRTFFNYFSSKEQALIPQDPSLVERLPEAVAARPPGESPLQALRAVLTDALAEMAPDRQADLRHRALLRSEPRLLAAQLAAWAELERALVRAVAERTGADAERDLYPALVVAAAVGAVRVALGRWRAGAGAALEALLGEAFDLLAAGLREPPREPGS